LASNIFPFGKVIITFLIASATVMENYNQLLNMAKQIQKTTKCASILSLLISNLLSFATFAWVSRQDWNMG
jgi:hypothetical protein